MMVSFPLRWSGGFFLLCLVLFSGEVFAGTGSPRAFQRYVGDYDAIGTFRNQTLVGTVNATITTAGTLQIADSPKAAVLVLSGKAVTTAGVESDVTWTLDFRRKNVCTVKVVFASGTTMTMTGKYVANRRRASFQGQIALKGGTLTKLGQSTGRLRFSATGIKYVQKDDYADQDITVRQNLTKG